MGSSLGVLSMSRTVSGGAGGSPRRRTQSSPKMSVVCSMRKVMSDAARMESSGEMLSVHSRLDDMHTARLYDVILLTSLLRAM